MRESLKRDLDRERDRERDRAGILPPTAPSATTVAKRRGLAVKASAVFLLLLLLLLFEDMTSNGMVEVKGESEDQRRTKATSLSFLCS